MKISPKLIIIRGPSGAGKSSVAKLLHMQSKRPTLLVSEDQIRKMFNDHHRSDHKISKDLATSIALTGLQDGYDVIFEGILDLKTNTERFDKIFKVHPEENYFFYLNISYDETLRRHETRPEKAEFSAEAMKKWWDYASPLGHTSETVISESSSLEETL